MVDDIDCKIGTINDGILLGRKRPPTTFEIRSAYIDGIKFYNEIIKYANWFLFTAEISNYYAQWKKKWWIVICRIAEVIRDILNGVLFYQMLCCVILIALSLTALERNADDFTYDFVISVSSLVAAFVSTFIYCMFADSLTTSLSRFGDIFYNSLWYEMPIKERALLILTIQRSQKLFRLNGYRFYDCSLESFATVNLFDNKMLHTNSQLFIIYSTIQIITGYKGISIILYGPTQVQIGHQRAPDIVWSCNNNDCAEK